MKLETPTQPPGLFSVRKTASVQLDQRLFTLEEVAVHFSEEEWALLEPDQKALHREVMEEISGVLASLELESCKKGTPGDLLGRLTEAAEGTAWHPQEDFNRAQCVIHNNVGRTCAAPGLCPPPPPSRLALRPAKRKRVPRAERAVEKMITHSEKNRQELLRELDAEHRCTTAFIQELRDDAQGRLEMRRQIAALCEATQNFVRVLDRALNGLADELQGTLPCPATASLCGLLVSVCGVVVKGLSAICAIANTNEEEADLIADMAAWRLASRARTSQRIRALLLRGDTESRLLFSALWGMVPRQRRWWVYPSRTRWWTELELTDWDDEQWVANFQMTRGTLFEIADRLRPQLQRQNTSLRQAVPVEERVGITVWWLATQASYREVAHRFGLGRTTVGSIVVEVCLAIEHVLLKSEVCLGDHQKIMDGFRDLGFPHCVGAVDGCYIATGAPFAQREEDFRKNCSSMLLQGAVDHTGRFISIEVGYSGNQPNTFAFENSALCSAMDTGQFVPGNPTVTSRGIAIPPVILGGSAYPSRRWLMKPFTGALNGPREAAYNHAFNRCRKVVEAAFGRLRARWRCLSGRLPVAEENVVCVIASCVVLHNICESRGHGMTLRAETVAPTGLFSQISPHSQEQGAEGEAVQAALADLVWTCW
ncbi:uncharacterized protein LOC134488882 [Candoia aspera]|uniref:uncharacterized protein LOC134488882 n=1 Tax=Candoia aspera TaxID=51853 RepID=UPI002FD86E67